jgi:hypothetical protein
MSRYEVRGLERGKELVRSLAKRGAAKGADDERLRAQVLVSRVRRVSGPVTSLH